jgi:hypothetical protein
MAVNETMVVFALPLEPPAGLSKLTAAAYRVQAQQAWIEYCESNGRSYSGENGAAIREADAAELKSLISVCDHMKGA